jgi:hypothetical protein
LSSITSSPFSSIAPLLLMTSVTAQHAKLFLLAYSCSSIKVSKQDPVFFPPIPQIIPTWHSTSKLLQKSCIFCLHKKSSFRSFQALSSTNLESWEKKVTLHRKTKSQIVIFAVNNAFKSIFNYKGSSSTSEKLITNSATFTIFSIFAEKQGQSTGSMNTSFGNHMKKLTMIGFPMVSVCRN